MAKKELLFSKGYHLEVTSWENDGDNYKTVTEFCGDNEADAKTLLKFCKEFWSSHHSGKEIGIGNMMEYDYEEAGKKAQDYLRNNKDVLEALNRFYKKTINVEDEDEVYDLIIADFNGNLFGNSEYYVARVFDRARIIHSPEDTYVEVVGSASRR